MAFENRKILFIASGILAITAILYIIANGLPIWTKSSGTSVSITVGLWQVCRLQGAKLSCISLPTEVVSDKIKAARAFMTICSILCPLSIISIISIISVNENVKKNISFLSKGLAIASLISGIIGVSLGISFSVNEINAGASMGVSCILAIIGLVFNIIGTIITFFIK
ncbi:hypothetical protein I4U23_027264 [Adineta vaga]|nr:hypothetical protein I4U23_027264 [Adineta vaga]